MQRIAFLLGATAADAGAGAGAAIGERGAAVAYFSLSKTALFHWQAFLPVLLEPDGVLSALRLVHGPLEAERSGGDASARVGPAGARLDAVAALQKLRTGTGEAVTTCCCTGKAARFSVASASSTCTS